MRDFLFSSLFFLVFPALCLAQENPTPTPAPAPTPSAAPAPEAPGVEPVIVRTVDGLPMEVEILALEGERIRVRNLVSGRVLSVPLSAQDEELQKQLQERASAVHKQLTSMKFRVDIVENPSPNKTLPLPQTTRVLSGETPRPAPPPPPPANAGAKGTAAAAGIPAPPPRVLYPGGRCLRIHSPVTYGVNIPVKVHLYWYAKLPQKATWSMESKEVVTLDIPPDPANVYYSLPHSFANP